MEVLHDIKTEEQCSICGSIKYKRIGCVACAIEAKNKKRREKKPRRENDCFSIYKHYDKNNDCIYIGISRYFNERQMVHNYASAHKEEIEKVLYCKLENSVQMRVYEIYYINKYSPKYNISENNKADVSFLDTIPELIFKEYVKGGINE